MTITREKIIAFACASALTAAGIVLLLPGPVAKERTLRQQDIGSAPRDESKKSSDPAAAHLPRVDRPAPGILRPPKKPAPRAFAIRARFLRLAKKDRYAAIGDALRLSGVQRVLALSTLAAAWRNDPRTGYKELAAMVDTIIALAQSTPLTAEARARQNLAFQSLSSGDSSLAILSVRLANRLLTGDKRTSTLSMAASAYSKVDPATAFAFGNSLDGNAYQNFLVMFSNGWAAQNPGAAAQWVATISDPRVHDLIVTSVAASLTKRNPDGAAQWIESLMVNASRQTAIRELGTLWASTDTAAALSWAARLASPTEQQQALAAIQTTAPTGVGIALSRAANGGYPVAADLISNGPAAQGGSIRRGDQIVAIGDAGNQWMDTAGMPLERVVAMIRGTAGQPVQLRLLPKGVTDVSQARTITIVRQQLLFKRPQQSGG